MSVKVDTKLCLYVHTKKGTAVYKQDDLVCVVTPDGQRFTGRIAYIFDTCFELDCSDKFHSKTIRINSHNIDDMFAVKGEME
jgi:hypothetical protein